MLRAMGIGPQDVFGGGQGQPGMDPDEMKIGNEADLGGNPVGVLQELCMKMKFPPPTYEVPFNDNHILITQLCYLALLSLKRFTLS